LLDEWPDALVVAHKTDLPDAWGAKVPRDALRASSLDGTGIEALGDAIVARLVPDVPPSGAAVPISERQVALLRAIEAAIERGDDEAARRSAAQLLD
jgi:tRNA U34 5-carboxymethylaminomethyl modifying GTPase MnmE/TrmE